MAAKFLQPVLQTAISNPSYSDPQKLQLSGELERLKKQKDIDVLVHEWAEKREAKGRIGVVDGKPVFGPRLAEDGGEDDDDLPIAPTFYVGMGGLEAMRRAMGGNN